MMNSQIPSLGYPPNWQLHPCLQLHASTLIALIRYAVLWAAPFVAVAVIAGLLVKFGGARRQFTM
jgi:hypothetical protein